MNINQDPRAVLKRLSNAKRILSEKLKENPEDELAQAVNEVIDELIHSMVEYTQAVFKDEDKNRDLKSFKERCKDVEDYQYQFEQLESNRKSSHDHMITMIKTADRACKSMGIDEIYGNLGEFEADTMKLMGPENRKKAEVAEKRSEIASWAFGVVAACSAAMELDDLGDYEHNDSDYARVANSMSNFDKKYGIENTIHEIINVGAQQESTKESKEEEKKDMKESNVR